MGGGYSSDQSVRLSQLSRDNHGHINSSERDIVALMMPIYYVECVVTNADIEIARNNWQMIVNNTASPFLDQLKIHDVPEGTNEHHRYQSALTMFFDMFYIRLFDIHPMCKNLFTSLQIQGRFLVKMIALCLSMNDDPLNFARALYKLTEVHNVRGIKSGELGIMGEVLFWTLRKCLGDVEFDDSANLVWIKILSCMLKHMVPVAVAYELKTKGVNQIARVKAIPIFKDDKGKEKDATTIPISSAAPSGDTNLHINEAL